MQEIIKILKGSPVRPGEGRQVQTKTEVDGGHGGAHGVGDGGPILHRHAGHLQQRSLQQIGQEAQEIETPFIF